MAKKIRPEVLTRITRNRELMDKLGKSTKTHGRSSILKVNRWIRENKPDGPLTTMTRLQMISRALEKPVKNLIENVRIEIDISRVGERKDTCQRQVLETSC